MKPLYFVSLLPIALCLLLPACSRDGEAGDKSAEEVGGDAPTNRVDIPTTVRNNLGITFAKVERRSVATTVRVPGSFELQPLARHEYRLMLPGRVEFAVDQFDEVKPGTILYRFRSPKWLELQAQIDLVSASLDQARSKYEAAEARSTALKEADFKRADLETQVTELRADVTKSEAELQAALNNAARTLNLQGGSKSTGMTPDDLLAPVEDDGQSIPFYQTIDTIEVRATEPGFVEALAVTDGAFVEEATLVLTTVDPSKVRFRALGLQSDIPTFENGQQVRIAPPQGNGSDINESVEAKLTVGLSADPNQRTITLFAQPEELRSWIRPGVSAFLEVAAESTGGVVLAIPRSAVVKDGITHVFFKRDPGDANKAIRVEADLGVDDGRWVEIKSEIGPSDEVVLDGAYELKLATAQSGTAQKGGHFHADGTYHAEEE
jgi:hypothetical protein